MKSHTLTALLSATLLSAGPVQHYPHPQRASVWPGEIVAATGWIWVDLEGDGHLELYAPGGARASDRLFVVAEDGRLVDRSHELGLAVLPGAAAGAFADVDGDGRLDLLRRVGGSCELLRLNESGFLEDVSATLAVDPSDDVLAARFVDFDGDGDGDLELATARGVALYANQAGVFALALELPVGARLVGWVPADAGHEISPAGPGAEGIAADSAGSGTDADLLASSTDAPGAAGSPTGTAPGRGTAAVSPGAAAAAGSPLAMTCLPFLRDQATGSCLPASSVPTAGMLYPLGDELFIDAGTGNVGVGITTPAVTLEVAGLVQALGTSSGSPITFTENYSSTGPAWGLGGSSFSTSGVGVQGQVHGGGDGVIGLHLSTAGGNGVRGVTASGDAKGVSGQNNAMSGLAFGVHGSTLSTAGRGIYGTSPGGVGVEGVNTGTSGPADGIRGWTASPAGAGVYGVNTVGGQGVFGDGQATSGVSDGVLGRTFSPHGSTAGVVGENLATTGFPRGILGLCGAAGGRAVFGSADHTSGSNIGVAGRTFSSAGFGVHSTGNFGGTGAKYFIQPHPTDAAQEIRFVCLEGNESGTYFRGTTRLEGGAAVVDVPEEFRLVTEFDGLSIQLTSIGRAEVWVDAYDLESIRLAGDRDVEVHYLVNGVRRGFAEHEPFHTNQSFVPEIAGAPFGTQYPPALRRILVENGTLNPDFTPNRATAARLGWVLGDAVVEQRSGSPRRQPPPVTDPGSGATPVPVPYPSATTLPERAK